MDATLLILRLALVGVFALAAVTKLADQAGSRTAMEGFGVPRRLAAPAGLALPLIELVIAFLLVPISTAWWGALASLVLMLAFIAGIGYTLLKGRTPDCHCFGRIHSEPIGPPTLIRNGLLALVAAVLVMRGSDGQGTSALEWVGDVSTMAVLLLGLAGFTLGAVALVSWTLVHLMQQNGRLLVRIEILEATTAAGMPLAGRDSPSLSGPPAGTPAPAFSLPPLDGELVTLDNLRASGKPVMLVFTDPECGPSAALLPEIGRWQQEYAQALTVALVSRGSRDANVVKTAEHGIHQVLLQQDREVSEAYQSTPTPSAVLIRLDGTIAAPAVLGAEAIRELVIRATSRPVPVHPSAAKGNGLHPVPAQSRVGQPAPEVTLPNLAGETVTLQSFQGNRILVLFWNPGCGFCSRMLDDLKAWENGPPADAPRLLVVSTDTPDANRAMGLQATVVLDQDFATGRAFGVAGTPSAILVDAAGRIDSDVAVGALAVLALAGARSEDAVT